jgi:hypothetical protein
MHLHDRHGAHLTLQTRLKQARQSLAQGPADLASAAFPYRAESRCNSLGFTGVFVKNSLQSVTLFFQLRNFRRSSAN